MNIIRRFSGVFASLAPLYNTLYLLTYLLTWRIQVHNATVVSPDESETWSDFRMSNLIDCTYPHKFWGHTFWKAIILCFLWTLLLQNTRRRASLDSGRWKRKEVTASAPAPTAENKHGSTFVKLALSWESVTDNGHGRQCFKWWARGGRGLSQWWVIDFGYKGYGEGCPLSSDGAWVDS